VATPGAAKSVIRREIHGRRSDLLGQIRNRGVREFAARPAKPPGRAIHHQLCGKAGPGAGQLGIQKRQILKAQASARGQGPVHVQNDCHRHRPPRLFARRTG